MEEGQPGSPKGSNRTGNPATGTLSWQSFSGTGSNRIPEARDFSHERRLHVPCYMDQEGWYYFDENNGQNGLNLYTGAWKNESSGEVC